MAKSRLSGGYYGNAVETDGGSDGSGISGAEITVLVDSSIPTRKCVSLNSSCCDAFGVPVQVVPLSNLSPFQRKDLVNRLRSELEQTRTLQKKIELQRTNGVVLSSSSDILSSSNGHDRPRVGSSRKPSIPSSPSGNKLKPLGQSQKPRGWNRGSTGKFESATRTSPPCAANALWTKDCKSLLKRLMSQNNARIFNTPVDVVKWNLPDYFSIIKHPMDLGTIKGKIAAGEYASPMEFAGDVRLTFSNAMTYNPPGNQVHFMADTLSKYFELRWKTIEKKLPRSDALLLPAKPNTREDVKTTRPMPHSNKRKIISLPPQPAVMPPAKRVMSYQEKHKLGRELESLLGEVPVYVIDFLKENCSNGKECGEDEIEIEIDDLGDDTLFTLRKLLDDYLHEKQNNKPKLEVCDIEVLNDSGPSNSSLQAWKDNDPADEEVDIGGNEPPVSSYPPVEIEKDTTGRINKHLSPGSSDTDSSGSSDSESDEDEVKASSANVAKETGNVGSAAQIDEKIRAANTVDRDRECGPTVREVSHDKLYRAALLKNRFADTILKAREKTLTLGEKGDPEKLRQDREMLEMERRKEKARLQAEAKVAEDARMRVEAEAAAEARRRRELEREAARQALLQMEKTVKVIENSQFLEDLDMLTAVPVEQLPSSADEPSPDPSQDGMGGFKFGGSNPLEKLGLYIKADDEEEEGDPLCVPNPANDIEEGEID